MSWVAAFLLLASIMLSSGVVALTVAWLGHQYGFAGWAVVALLGGGWILYALLAREYPLASGQGSDREESKHE